MYNIYYYLGTYLNKIFFNLHNTQGTFYIVNNTSVNEDGSLKQKHINY